jgi:hypothetical protein
MSTIISDITVANTGRRIETSEMRMGALDLRARGGIAQGRSGAMPRGRGRLRRRRLAMSTTAAAPHRRAAGAPGQP